MRDRRTRDLQLEVYRILIPDEVRRHPRFEIACRHEIGEPKVEREAWSGRPRESRRIAATGRRCRQAERVGESKLVTRAGSDRHVEHTQLGTGSTPKVARQ